MMMTDEWLRVIEESELLSRMIVSSETAEAYRLAHHRVYSDPGLVREIADFARLKEQYEEVQRFGRYHPDYSTVMREVRTKKRELDLNDKVAALKMAENDLQDLLDEVSLLIGKTVSESVKVPVSNPFFETGSACGGSCGTGGGCSCSA
ncbi:regulator [Bhargavaea cecembensis]|uniref:Regulator n=1 Tax=Bhargavaea cecembensis TaxID=394098 RepID=A0A163FAV6_9BACL|nr:YlbF family regulator [Bhargavaea cecembensis]KZE38256.1 regulator [Bhargavaea cecembensis]